MIQEGQELGIATGVSVISPRLERDGRANEQLRASPKAEHFVVEDSGIVRMLNGEVAGADQRKRRLSSLIDCGSAALSSEEAARLQQLIMDNHMIFSPGDNDRGETDLIQMEIDTGDSHPRKQLVRRVPFAFRQDIAVQLQEMQSLGVIEPSDSPWASPVVMVQKKDGSLRFCIDYRNLNSVTKPDVFPLPHIVDLLDQLGQSRYFSTLHLASGYWQIPMHPNTRARTAFITHQGLYQFRVMAFGLRNAPAVFQCLIQRVLAGLNPITGIDFVVVYIDDILTFSWTLEDHLKHLSLVMEILCKAKLKLKPTKCHFVRKEVEYLGHVIT